MTFHFSRHGLAGREAALQRACEILPGATSWAILLGTLLLACWQPVAAAVVVIAFALYWLLRLLYLTIFLVLSYLRLSLERETDWLALIRDVDAFCASPPQAAAPPRAAAGSLRRRYAAWMHRRQLDALRRSGRLPPPSADIRHLIIVPVAQEPREVVEPGLVSLARQPLASQQLVVVLALEARAPAAVAAGIRALCDAYQGRFLRLWVETHPTGVPGEARVKGANASWAAAAAERYFAAQQIPPARVIVSCFDADTVVSDEYCSGLTYAFLTCPARTRASFQPIPVYHNNIWEVPGFARVLDIGASFFQLVEATNPEKLVTFSSHSMSFQALMEVGYWPVDMISDDSSIFWKAFIHYDGDYRVVPMYITLSMDVVNAGRWWKTALHVYKQKRRWAWGVENVPLVLRAFLRARRIPLYDRWRLGFKLFEGHIAWATWPWLLTLIGWVPAFLAWREFSSTVLYYSAPRITSTIFGLASLSLATTIVLSLCLLPRNPVRESLRHKIGHACEWLLIPLTSLFLGALPALDAQTRLMLGRHLEFWVSDKRRSRPPSS